MKIYIFYHIGAINADYSNIINDQIDLLIKTKLYEKVDKIFYSIVGNLNIDLPSKFERVYENQNYTVAELPMMDVILDYANKDTFKCLYFHTKGSGGNYIDSEIEVRRKWRKYMEYFNIELWEKNIKLLDNYDAIGTSFRAKTNKYENHYSGNFWWSKSEYIKTLNSVYNIIGYNRLSAEMWILSNPNAIYYNWCEYDTRKRKKKFITPDEYRKIK